MQFEIEGNPDYGLLLLKLERGDKILIESGAMSWMTADLDMKSTLLGGFVSALARKFLGGESFFLGEYGGDRGGEMALSPATPGSILHRRLEGETLWLTAGAFLACTPGITLSTKFGGLKALFSREGAFLIQASGHGDLFGHSYGSILEREVDGALRVDNGHVVAWEPSLDYRIGTMGGVKSTLFSGEGLVMNFEGRGKIWLQTRTLVATAGWITPFLRG